MRRRAAAAPGASVMLASTVPTGTDSSSSCRPKISPAAGAASSNVALSPSASAITWPSVTVSPSATSHSTTITCWSAGLDPVASTASTPSTSCAPSASVTSRPPIIAATASTTSRVDGSTSSWFT